MPLATNGTSETYVPVAADVGKWLKVRVSYTDGQGSGKSATSVSRGPIGASNSEPTFNDGMTAMRTLPENSDGGDERRECGGGHRHDSGDTLTYALKSGNDSGDFTIVSTSGQIQAKSGETYNFEGNEEQLHRHRDGARRQGRRGRQQHGRRRRNHGDHQPDERE